MNVYVISKIQKIYFKLKKILDDKNNAYQCRGGSKILGISKSHAYKVVQQLNKELRNQGYIVIAEKVSRAYFKEKIYGL